jgi:putative cell wall-binding protein
MKCKINNEITKKQQSFLALLLTVIMLFSSLLLNTQPVRANTNAPTIVSVSTDHIGKKITLAFDRPMADPSGTEDQFTVSVNGGKITFTYPVVGVAMSSDKKQIILNLSVLRAYLPTDVVTLSYTKGTVAAEDGTPMESFTDMAVNVNAISGVNLADIEPSATEIAYDPSVPELKYRFDDLMDYDNVNLAIYLTNGFFRPFVDDLNKYVKFYEKETGKIVPLPNKVTQPIDNRYMEVTDWYFKQVQGRAPLGLNLKSTVLKPSTTYVIEVQKGFTFNNDNKTTMTYSFEFTTTAHSTAKVPRTLQRIAGSSRTETSIAIAKEEFKDKAPDAVVLTTANGFPDALSGAGLAYKYNAPMLLVNKSVNDSKNVLDYVINNLSKGKNVYILGGEGVVGTDISDYLTSQGYNVMRIGGSDRYETNQKIVDNLNVDKGSTVILASADGFADALSVSSIAALKGYPILLSGKDSLPANVVSDITNIHPAHLYIMGGTGVLSTNIEEQIKNINANIKISRLSGNNRYETSMKIVDFFKSTGDTVTVASGTDFPDALSGALLAARKKSAILLVDNMDLTKQKDLLKKNSINNIVIFGGEGAVNSNTAEALTKK